MKDLILGIVKDYVKERRRKKEGLDNGKKAISQFKSAFCKDEDKGIQTEGNIW